jgi:DNA-binding CsgD family transcriptional regulator
VAVDQATTVPPGGGPLLERDGELSLLDGMIADAGAGQAHLVLVEGPAGIGKSRLVAEARRRATESGLRVLAARGGELEREFPFGVVHQLFEPVALDPKARKQAFAGAAAAAEPLFEPLQPASDGGEMTDTSYAFLHGLYWLTVNLSGDAPLLLAVDDLHWCDGASLRFLAYLVRRLEGLPAIVVGSLRPAEPGADSALLGELAADPLAVSLHPGLLSVESVGRLVRERMGEGAEEAFSAACHAATGGNPLLLQELLKSLEAEGMTPNAANAEAVKEVGPRAVSRAVVVRLARLPQDAVSVARAVAVLGDGTELGAVAALTGLDEDRAAQATRALAQAEVLRPDLPLGFVHPLVRAAIYHDISPGERELQHERAAQLLSHAGASSERVAAHLLVIPPRGDAEVAEVLQGAGRAAVQQGAADSAIAYLQRALEEPPRDSHRAEVLFELGLAELLMTGPAAAEHLRGAYERLRDPVRRAMAGVLLARTLVFTGAPEEGNAVAKRLADELPAEMDDLRQAAMAILPVGSANGARDRDPADWPDPYSDQPVGPGPGAKMLRAVSAWQAMISGATADDASRLALQALEGGVLIEADQGLFPVIAGIVLAVADRDEALETFEVQLGDAHRRGSLFGALGVHLWSGYARLRRGELPEAELLLRQAVDEADLWGSDTPSIAAYQYAFLASVLVETGDVDGARRTLEESGAGTGVSEGENFVRWSRMEVLLAEGAWEEALALGEEYEQAAASVRNPGWAAWRSLKAQALDKLGRSDEAVALVEDELKDARRWGAPGTVGRTLLALAQLNCEGGREHVEEAVELLEGSSAKLVHAKALAALGTALRHERKPTEAREPLRRALELADTCGSPVLAERVRSELYAAGARPRTTALSGVEALTASERRVADLAAGGQTNRDIAQTLFVTPKTVEVHLSNAYRKLGIRSRRELSGALAG